VCTVVLFYRCYKIIDCILILLHIEVLLIHYKVRVASFDTINEQSTRWSFFLQIIGNTGSTATTAAATTAATTAAANGGRGWPRSHQQTSVAGVRGQQQETGDSRSTRTG